MWGLHLLVRNDHDANLMALLQLDDGGTLLVEQEGSDIDWNLSMNLIGIILQRFFFDQTQNSQRQGFIIADGALPHAARADMGAGFIQ